MDANNKICFAYVSPNKETLLNSASGGAFFDLAYSFIKNLNGIVYGCAFVNMKAVHVRVEDTEDLSALQGSKYVHSNISNSLKKIQDDLQKGRFVLFSGTPCQVAAVKEFTKENNDKLYCVDIVCHGTPSQAIFDKYIGELSVKFKKNVNNIIFRFKDSRLFNKTRFVEKIIFDDGSYKIRPAYKSSYYSLFLNKYLYNETCYSCKFAKPDRISDITLGDFWGLKNTKIDKSKGISMVYPSTDKGLKLIKEFLKNLEEHKLDEATCNNEQLVKPSAKPCKNVENYDSIEKISKKVLRKYKIKAKISYIIPRFIKNLK